MLEKEMRRQLKHKFSLEMPQALLQPIESGRTGRGIPDIFFKAAYAEGWIELKEIVFTNTQIEIPFQSGQLSWIRRYTKLRGNIILLMTYKKSLYTLGLEKEWAAIKALDIMYRYESIKEFDAAACFMGTLKDLDLRKLLQNPYD